LPGGVRTHWRTPPCHGAHPERTFDLNGLLTWPNTFLK
jgi:hypothetical protein